MQDNDEQILKILEDRYLKRLNEAELARVACESFKNSMGIETGSPLKEFKLNASNSHTDYPTDGTLIDKLRYVESNIFRKVWKKSEMEKELKDLEGVNTKSLNSLYIKFNEFVADRELIQIKFNKSNKKVFYTTEPAWVKGEKGKEYIVDEHAHNEIVDLIQNNSIEHIECRGRNGR